jgi:Fe-S-cluster containining protein
MAARVIKTGFSRQSDFGYCCNRCLTCCRFKTIQLNPYEVARMARNRGISTSEFIHTFTEKGGTVLRFKTDGTCVFLNDQGCGVHADRPLVCRLYPLGRYVDFKGSETFSQIELEEGCKGRCHENGDVEQYLEEQGALPYMHAADLYLDLLIRLLEQLSTRDANSSEFNAILDAVTTVSEKASSEEGLFWNDMDRILADYCGLSGGTVPESIDDRMILHIKAVLSWAESS